MLQSNVAVALLLFGVSLGCSHARPSAAEVSVGGSVSSELGENLTAGATVEGATGPGLSAPSISVTAVTQGPVTEWVRCYQGFRSAADASVDIVRLGTVCGPVTGMQLMGPRFAGSLEAGIDSRVRIDLERECFRLVAAADHDVADLELEVVSGSGESLALGNQGLPWLVLPVAGPLCVASKGQYSLVLRTHGGAGEFAVGLLKYWPMGDAKLKP